MPSSHLTLCHPLLLPPSTQRLGEVRQSPEVTQQVTEWAAQGMADLLGCLSLLRELLEGISCCMSSPVFLMCPAKGHLRRPHPCIPVPAFPQAFR